MKRRFPTLVVDISILLICLLSLSLLSSKTLGQGSGYVKIQTAYGTYRYSLSTDRIVEVKGPLGKTIIEIEGGHAHVLDSDCPTKSCTFQAPISKPNTWIACLPNEVLLSVVGPEPNDVEVDDVAN